MDKDPKEFAPLIVFDPFTYFYKEFPLQRVSAAYDCIVFEQLMKVRCSMLIESLPILYSISPFAEKTAQNEAQHLENRKFPK